MEWLLRSTVLMDFEVDADGMRSEDCKEANSVDEACNFPSSIWYRIGDQDNIPMGVNEQDERIFSS